MRINISEYIKAKCPKLVLGCISADIIISESNPELKKLIFDACEPIKKMEMESIKDIPAIQSSRDAYKALGKEPSRYRLSAEALHRRIIKGQDLYFVNNVVDIINLSSIKTGYSIGGYDQEKIKGDVLMDLGSQYDEYEAIGRGLMNVEFLPVFRDSLGAFGSPTSDSERTKISDKTRKILLVFLNFGGHEDIHSALELTVCLLKTFAFAGNIEISFSH